MVKARELNRHMADMLLALRNLNLVVLDPDTSPLVEIPPNNNSLIMRAIKIKKSVIDCSEAVIESYADVRCKPMEFQVGDMVMLKVSPWKGVIRFGKRGKLSPRYHWDSFKSIERWSPLAYNVGAS
ncbi:hypothetical protein Tco_1328710 [Tanacetum coccineum]